MNTLLEADLDHVLAKTTGVWDELRGQEIFITGGTGFFGQWFLESFLWANEKLKLEARATVLTRDASAFRKRSPRLAGAPALTFHEGDVRTFEFPKRKFSHVIHAATAASVSMNDEQPLEMLDVIIQGTRRALELTEASGAKKFLLTSSGAVYGRQPEDMTHVPEDYKGSPDLLDPKAAYGEGKRVAEYLCTVFNRRHGIETKIARCFAFVGPYLPFDIHFAIGNFIRDGMAKTPIHVGGDGTPRRSYLYAGDLMIWLWTILAKGKACHPYNVGSEADVSIATLAGKIATYFHSKVVIDGAPDPRKPIQRYVPSTRRAYQELGLETWIELGDAIRRTEEWARKKA
jgi:dTDP-glucose 4,6-dehydratase